jgi:lipopolysaccharide/colanic/teichoic acid biosynthesis glycosyltransferase
VDDALKRGLDVLIASALLVLALPVLVVLVVIIRLDSPGNPLYRCRRVGYNGRTFMMLKLRKMRDDAEGISLTLADDERFTRIGRFLAKSKFDELPQLWHVIRGDMSLVGPRPESPEFVSHFAADYNLIVNVRPGITGWSQLAFVDESEMHDLNDPVGHYLGAMMPLKVAMDVRYVRERTVRKDLGILLLTAMAVGMRRVDSKRVGVISSLPHEPLERIT